MKKSLHDSGLVVCLLFIMGPLFNFAQSNPNLNWQIFSSSMNVYTSLRPFAKPLQYEPALNLVSFVQRKSDTYTCTPDPGGSGQSGVIVAMLSPNWGSHWDSTCLWTNQTYYGRYPQGAVYNPPGNQSLTNAYCVSSGPVVTTAGFSGFYTASKVLGPGNYNNSPGTASNSMQYFPNSSSLGFCYYADNAFSVSGDGVVHSLGYLSDPVVSPMLRGAALLKGTFSANAFTWSSDSLVCGAAYYGGGYKCMHSEAMMAWNQAGTVGYVVFMASRFGSVASNRGWQPLVYKSTNSGNSWTLTPSMDFNSPGAGFLKQHLAPVYAGSPNAGMLIPQVDCNEGWDLTVDKNNCLHIVALVNGARHYNLDSISSRRYYGSEGYKWEHKPGRRPYLTDFMLSSAGNWTYGLIDSLSSEAPGSGTDPGSSYNPWNGAGGIGVTNLARVQCSRSADGNYVLVSWTETDSTQNLQQTKWNSKPDIKVRLIDCNTYNISPSELNVSTSSGTLVSGRASLHFMSPVSDTAHLSGGQIHVRVPLSITNQENYSTLISCQHWFAGDTLHFSGALIPFTQSITATSVNDYYPQVSLQTGVFPNPFSDRITVTGLPDDQNEWKVSVISTLGTEVASLSLKGGKRDIDLGYLPEGVYLLRLSSVNSECCFRILRH
ncbi:MAG TPA: T9SS type A sorting domain-containing protein [Bacteroidia bacterium]|nr:T9SS type A sorting domain-containing protein [Bacteroidia bacterium]